METIEFNPKMLNFSFDLSKANYQIDTLQNKLLEFYIRADPKFRMAFYTNYTNDYIQYIKDKTQLNEPIHVSVIGNVRSGKSYSAITQCAIHQAYYKRWFEPKYICANKFEFIDKLQTFPEDELKNHIFLIDEDKQAVYGVGSVSRKIKMTDTQNIIAINNISTIMLQPIEWANVSANYGNRLFGRCFETKTVRMMLYNLTEKGRGGQTPMGNIYMPIFTKFYPPEIADPLEKEYLKRKHEWVDAEQRGENDILEELKKKSAIEFSKDDKYDSLLTKSDRLTYISQTLGSEYTVGEVAEIESITKLIKQGVL